MRLIDADALKETGKKWFIDERYYHPLEKPQNMSESTFLKLIDNAPTINSGRVYLNDIVRDIGEENE